MMAGKSSGALVLYSGKNPRLRMQAYNLAKGISLERRIRTIELYCIDSLQQGKIYSVNKLIQVNRAEDSWVFIRNGDQHIAWLNAINPDKISRFDSIKADVLVIAKFIHLREMESLKHITGRQIVFDSSCKPLMIKENSVWFAEAGILPYDVAASGAFMFGN